MNRKNSFLLAGVSLILTVILVCLVRFVDVKPIGPEGTSIGLAGINGMMAEKFGMDLTWYRITEILGIVAILTAALFAVIGVIELVQRRSLKKVDRELFVLAGLYVVTVILYFLFEKVVVNTRPVILPDETHPEASFPSSHTMLVCVVMGSAMTMIPKYVKLPALRTALIAVCGVVIGLTVAGRLFSGAHWFTDILGGVLISITLLSLFDGVLGMLSKGKEKTR